MSESIPKDYLITIADDILEEKASYSVEKTLSDEEATSSDEESDEEITSSNKKISHVNSPQYPHNGKKIARVVFSPNKKYVASASLEDNSVCVWKIPKDVKTMEDVKTTEENSKQELKLICSFKFKRIDLKKPIRVSNSLDILIGYRKEDNLFLEIRDIINEQKKLLIAQGIKDEETEVKEILNAQEIKDEDTRRFKLFNAQKYLNGRVDCIEFLENGDLAVVEGDPAYQERVLILLDIPFVIMQWNLLTREFEAQYELDWRLTSWKSISMELNYNAECLAPPQKTTLDLLCTSSYIIRYGDSIETKCLKLTDNNNKACSLFGVENKMDQHSNVNQIEEIRMNLHTAYRHAKEISKYKKPKIYEGQQYTWIVECRSENFIVELTVLHTAKEAEEKKSKIGNIQGSDTDPTIGPTIGPTMGPTIGPTMGPSIVSVDELVNYLEKIEKDECSEALQQILPNIRKIVNKECGQK
ncbi:13378_t:CDS:2 [Acaulospora morrowiae]|uniref:13378_t:CDS:1 n=1 Tax=Acaulospora morrowiae TaxID=94023 RepID=A0A9N8VT25_9GLOM|nr:13378_t:CDS:2 [Acaulospora morrowiae]